ncbi:hypothetical protein LXL04_002123 [Taraxacum kok-saghyz]
MDEFGEDYTSSTSIEPNSPFKGNDLKKLCEEMDFKLKNAHKKRMKIKRFLSATTSSASDRKKKKTAERNKTQTLDVDKQHYFPRSYSFDSKDSRMADDINNNLPPYDPIKNYLSPRPPYLQYNPDRHHDIISRQNNLTRVRRRASYDCSLGASSREDASEETYIFTPEDELDEEHEHEEENEEVFDDFEEVISGWNWKVFMKYLMVIIVLMLATFTITSMNSTNLSHAQEAVRGFMNLYNKTCMCSIFKTLGFDFSGVGKLSKREIDVNLDHVGNDYTESKTEEIKEVQNEYYRDDIWSNNDNGQFGNSHANEIQEKEETSYELHEPVIITSEEFYSDFDRGHEVREELEILEMMVDEDDEKEDGNNMGLNENTLIKLERFDHLFAAFIGGSILILATLGIIYYAKKSKIPSPNTSKYLESFVNSSPLTYKKILSGSLIDSDEVFSSEEKSSYLEFSTDSPSYGSFTVEKKIVKKKTSKKPEVVLSPVRRSSRIHNRSITSP